jgi:hypothetical protein
MRRERPGEKAANHIRQLPRRQASPPNLIACWLKPLGLVKSKLKSPAAINNKAVRINSGGLCSSWLRGYQ